jgi:cytoskeletal protein CcmA (bactofilin family)
VFTKVIGKTNEPDDSGQPAYAPANQPRPPAPAPSATPEPVVPAASAAATGGVRNILSSDVEITGSVKFTNDLLVDGRIDGQISSDGNLTIGENAKIKAEIKTASVIVHGKVHGNITVTDRVELRAGSEVVGDIKAKILFVEASAVFVGKSEVGTPSTISAGQAAKPSDSAAKSEPAQKSAPAPAGKPDGNKPGASKPGDAKQAGSESNKPKPAGGSPQQGTLAGT